MFTSRGQRRKEAGKRPTVVMLMRRKLVSSAASRGRLGLAGTPGEQLHPHAKLTQKLAYYGAEGYDDAEHHTLSHRPSIYLPTCKYLGITETQQLHEILN